MSIDYQHSIPLAVKFSSSLQEGEFIAYGSTWMGEPDAYNDVVAKNAFAKSLASHAAANTTPALLWSHDQQQPLGKITKLTEDDHGLLMHGKLALEVARAKEALALMRCGSIGFSIGYQVAAATRLPQGVRRLDEIKLFEISCVAIPANSNARLVSVKTRPGLADQHSPRTIEKVLRDGGFSWRLARKIASASRPLLKERDVLQADEPITKRLLAAKAAIQNSLSKD